MWQVRPLANEKYNKQFQILVLKGIGYAKVYLLKGTRAERIATIEHAPVRWA